MDYAKLGLQLDIQCKYEKSILEYEKAIKQNAQSMDIFINLSFLYWLSASDFSWADTFNIPLIIRHNGIDRLTELLKIAKSKFPEYAEIYFLEKYFLDRLGYGEILTQSDVLGIISKYKEVSNVPYFFLYFFDKNKYIEKRNQLLNDCLKRKCHLSFAVLI